MSFNKKIMIVAGEASGDLHGSNLIKEYRKIDETAHFYGIGSTKMRAAGLEVLHDSKEIAVVGIVEVLKHISVINRALSDLKKRLYREKPDLLILIDFPDFNLRLASHAKKAGIKVLYYISPQVWVWREGRIKKIAKFVDKMAVIFPFEEELYKKEGVDVSFVGHPLVDCVKPTLTREEYLDKLDIPEGSRIITILPGSRTGEIDRFLEVLLDAAKIISDEIKDCYFLVSIAPTVKDSVIEDTFKRHGLYGTTIKGSVYNAINASEFVLTKSGTSTLETAIIAVPMVIFYKVSPFTYFIGKKIFRIETKRIGLANIVHSENIVPELVQDEVKAERIADEALKILKNKKLYDSIKDKLQSTRERLGNEGASKKIAMLVKDMLKDEKTS